MIAKNKIFLFVALIFIFCFNNTGAQINDTLNQNDFSKLSLQDLIQTEISVTNKLEIPLNESPGVVSVITDKEIINSGARDLLELLQLIPGFHFGAEWDNIVGIGVRGNNATEGKFLVLFDGHQLNETNFGSFSFGQHIQLNNIKRIEIIRGPGSVIYGGSAELAVINIISKKGDEANGVKISSEYGFSDNETSYYSVQSYAGKKFDNGLNFILATGYKTGNRSNRKIFTADSSVINYADSSTIEAMNINIQCSYKNLSSYVMYDHNSIQNTEAVGSVLFENLLAASEYQIKFNDSLQIKPRINWKYQKPWFFKNNISKEFYNSANSRADVIIPITYKPLNYLTLVTGIETYWDYSKKMNDTVVFSSNNKRSISFYNYSLFEEASFKTKYVNVTAGGRIEYQEPYGFSVAPRFILTKKINQYHFKLLYNQAYKSPTISNIDYNNSIQPEITTVYELEAGARLTSVLSLTVDIFDIHIHNPILYIPNPVTGADYYTNFPSTGSRGIEVELKIKDKWGYLAAEYSYYQKAYNEIPNYNIEGINDCYGAFPKHKASVISNFEINKNINCNFSLLTFGERYTYIHSNKNWTEAILKKYKPSFILNINLTYKNLFTKGIIASIGVHDLTNTRFEYINSYQGWQNPVPAQGREFFIRLTYDFQFNMKKQSE